MNSQDSHPKNSWEILCSTIPIPENTGPDSPGRVILEKKTKQNQNQNKQ